MRKNILKKMILPITILFILSGSGIYLLNTKGGLHIGFSLIAKVIPGKLTIQKLDGKLLGPIDAAKIYYTNKEIDLSIDKLRLDLKMGNILSGKSPISIIHADNIKINLKEAGGDKGKIDFAEIIALFKRVFLVLEDLQLKNILLQKKASEILKIKEITFTARVDDQNIDFLKFSLSSKKIKILLQGSLKDEWDIKWSLVSQGLMGNIDCHGKIYGKHDNPEFQGNIKAKNFKYDKVLFSGLQGDIYATRKGSKFKLNFRSPKISLLSFNKLDLSGFVNLAEFKVELGATKMFFPVGEDTQSLELTKGDIQGNFNKRQGFSSEALFATKNSGSLKVGLKLPRLPSFVGDVIIKGENFSLINTKQYQVTVSPDLKLKITADRLSLTGKVFVPQAKVQPADFGVEGSLPQEIVYVGKTKKRKGFDPNLYTDIQLELGRDVFINIVGLQGRLKGKLQLIDEPKKNTTAFGELHIKDGKYDIYGQQLTITKGELNFLGGSVTNPGVNLEAIRKFRELSGQGLIVGIRMMGMLNDPKIYLFSVPAGLSNPDILSYLITGKSSEQATGSSAQLLLQAATALNIGGANKMGGLISDLREKLGFSEFGFSEEISKKTGTLTTNTAFILGKFLTPKIYASYSIGLLDEANIFRVKYYINKYFSIQSESSTAGDGGVDLIYTIER